LKILRIVSAGFEEGGVENGIVETNRILRQRGHQVRVLSSDMRPDREHFSDYEFPAIPEGGPRKFFFTAFNLPAYRRLKQVLAEFQPDIVLIGTMQQATAAILFALRHRPTLLGVHGPEVFVRALLPWHLAPRDYRGEPYVLRHLTTRGWLHYAYFRWVCGAPYALGMRYVDRILCFSRYTCRLVESEGRVCEHVPNGVSLAVPTPVDQDARALLYAGRLQPYKGVHILVRAMALIVQVVPDAVLRVAGEGAYAPELQRLTVELGLDRNVEFLGHLSQDQLAEEYRRCAVFVLPSTWPETFGKVGVEAMSAGRPVIASDIGGVGDWLEDGVNGYLVPPGDVPAIADRALRLLTDPDLLSRMGDRAARVAQLFSMEAFATRLEQVMARCLEESSGRTPARAADGRAGRD